MRRAFINDTKLLRMYSRDIYSMDSVKSVSLLYKLYDDDTGTLGLRELRLKEENGML